MSQPIQFPDESLSNDARRAIWECEPQAQRTFTPTQATVARSAGVFHWTPEGRRLYDYSSGVLVSNLGHNPARWMQTFFRELGWTPEMMTADGEGHYHPAAPLTAYNAISPVERTAARRLLENVRRSPGGGRLDSVLWAASGSEAIQKALWACLSRDRTRDMIIATRYGFHGKKGLSNAVTGSETDAERDPRVRFVGFPMAEIADHDFDPEQVPLAQYRDELERLRHQFGRRLTCLITEPYLGGGGSYHPPKAYHQLLQEFCREHDILLVFDEVQANFGRTGRMYAFESYGVEPDFVVLGKGLGNGVPVAAVVGRRDVMNHLKYGEASDTWSANPLACAAVVATLDEFESTDVLEHTRRLTPLFLEQLDRLKATGLVRHVRGEGMVFGIECQAAGDLSASQVAALVVETSYLGESGGDGIHLLGPLSGKVIRISPPLTITREEAAASLDLLNRLVQKAADRLREPAAVAAT